MVLMHRDKDVEEEVKHWYDTKVYLVASRVMSIQIGTCYYTVCFLRLWCNLFFARICEQRM